MNVQWDKASVSIMGSDGEALYVGEATNIEFEIASAIVADPVNGKTIVEWALRNLDIPTIWQLDRLFGIYYDGVGPRTVADVIADVDMMLAEDRDATLSFIRDRLPC